MEATLATRAAPFLITTLLVAAPAWAQSADTSAGLPGGTPASQSVPPATSGPGGGSGTGHAAMLHGRRAVVARQPGETIHSLTERRIADLHSRLHITAEQTRQWDQFAQVMRQNATELEQTNRQRAEQLGSMSAVDNVQSFAQLEQQRANDMQRVVPALQALYAALSDQQKALADQLFRNYATSERTRRQAAAR
jgi:periplasmic protein CpxP/Spy